MVDKVIEFKMGELFSGPGGLGLGSKLAEIKIDNRVYKISHAWANDIDEDACRTYRTNIMPDNPEMVINKPVEKLDLSNLPKIDAFSFGFPCNDFSIVGKQKGFDGEYGPLYSYGAEVLDKKNPKWFLAENVGGLKSSNDGEAFKVILRDLAKAGKGYNLTPHLYKFEDYGIPQKRHRIIIIGIRKDLGFQFEVPKPTHIDNYITAKEAIENPPIPEDLDNHNYSRHTKRVKKFIDKIPPGKNAWCDEIPEDMRLNVKGAKMSNIYRRLDPKEPAYTVTGSGGGGTYMYHYTEARALTNRERARLQTFSDDFIFKGNKESIRKQIGMAVPPKGAKIIYEAVLKTFAGIDYESIKSDWWEKQDINLNRKAVNA